MKKIFCIIVLYCILAITPTKAFEVKSMQDLGVDTSITRTDRNYVLPEQIVVSPIFLEEIPLGFNSKDWVRAIFYYTIERLGFGNNPFHYLVTEDGDIFLSNTDGEEKKVNIAGIGENVLLVGYLSETSRNSFSNESESSLRELLLKLCNNNGIKPENIIVSGIKFKKNDETNSVVIETQNLFGNFLNKINEIVVGITPSYKPAPLNLKAEVTQISLSETETDPGSELFVSIKIKNTGKRGFYEGKASEILLTRLDSPFSFFYINSVWASQSQAYLMDNSQVLLPGEEAEFQVKFKTPLAIGAVSEMFTLKTIEGTQVEVVPFEIIITAKKTDKQIVEIRNNANGFVDIKSQPYASASTVLRASSGERFFLIRENLDTLWITIDIGGGVEGFVALWNLTYL